MGSGDAGNWIGIMEWFMLDTILKFLFFHGLGPLPLSQVLPAWARTLPKDPASLGIPSQHFPTLTGRNSFPLFHLTLHSVSLKPFHFVLSLQALVNNLPPSFSWAPSGTGRLHLGHPDYLSAESCGSFITCGILLVAGNFVSSAPSLAAIGEQNVGIKSPEQNSGQAQYTCVFQFLCPQCDWKS